MKYDYINLMSGDKYLIRFRDNELIGFVSVSSLREAKNYASCFPNIKKSCSHLDDSNGKNQMRQNE